MQNKKDSVDFVTYCKSNNMTYLLDEWNYEKNTNIKPDNIKPKGDKKVWWICSLGHEWQTEVKSRIKGTKCPICSGRIILAGYNDFLTWCKNNDRNDLIEEWDYEKNIIQPDQISPKNNKKVSWTCSLGHKWDATINSRTRTKSCGCPYCSVPIKSILVGFNDFETKCKENGREYLLKEWNYERNIDVTPQSVTYRSGKRIWWKCSKGHEWMAPIDSRTDGTNCPVCARTSTSFPEQAIAYYLSKQFSVLQRYSIKRHEIDIFLEDYNLGIEYDGIRYHSSEKSSEKEKKKDSFFSHLGITIIHVKEDKDKNFIDGNILYYTIEDKQYLDDKFNNVLNTLFKMISDYTKVSFLPNVNLLKDELNIKQHYASYMKKNSFASLYPQFADGWDVEKNKGMTPDLFSAKSHTKVWWKCDKGHSWKAAISTRSNLGCPYCAGQRLLSGTNDLESWCKDNNPALLHEWDYEKNTSTPSEEMRTSNKKFWWRCDKGHEWEATIANRVHGTNCPYCNTGLVPHRKLMSFKEWCLSSGNEELLSEWNYDKNTSITPDDISRASHTKVWWKCDKGHEWEAVLKSRIYNHGCPYCSPTNKKVLSGVNDLVTWCNQNNKSYILEEWDYDNNEDLKPEMFTHGSHKRINWICEKGHKWNAVIKERTKINGNKCPFCKKEI